MKVLSRVPPESVSDSELRISDVLGSFADKDP